MPARMGSPATKHTQYTTHVHTHTHSQETQRCQEWPPCDAHPQLCFQIHSSQVRVGKTPRPQQVKEENHSEGKKGSRPP